MPLDASTEPRRIGSEGSAWVSRQTAVGIALAVAITLAWFALHLGLVFFYDWTPQTIALAPLFVAIQTWLCIGLFIVAHDCMHGSLAPFRPGVNRWFGRLCLFLYAAFSYDRLIGKHFAHHRHSGTADDPDFDEDHPDAFWPWYLRFIREYFSLREFAILTAILFTYVVLLGASVVNILAFFALPAWISSAQIFYFGTYRPHRVEEDGFADRHNSRSNEYSWFASLLTCFHFGYHHEHHLHPHLPWWKLPRARGSRGYAETKRPSEGLGAA